MSEPHADLALLDLLGRLEACDYRFVTPTPATHARLLSRRGSDRARNLRDVFGWSLPFEPDLLEPQLMDLANRAEIIVAGTDGLRSKVRVSRVHDQLFLHSAYPTESTDAVFLGPDTYRFADFLTQELAALRGVARIVDIGTGAGVGGVLAGRARPDASLILTDINPLALRLAKINAMHAGVDAALSCGDGLGGVQGEIDLILANPPYIVDDQARTYRDGGGMHGAELSLKWALQAAERLSPGGAMLLYTGSAIVSGRDALHEALLGALPSLGCTLRYRELDPDIFGEELDNPAYAEVERIAAVGAVVVRST